jgi:hypothetical protein
MPSPIAPSDRIRRRNGTLTSSLGAGAAVMDLERGRYLSLNESAGAVWALLETPRQLDEIVAALRTEFDVPEGVCLEQVTGLAEKWLEAGMIEIEAAGA